MEITDRVIDAKISIKFSSDKASVRAMDKFSTDYPNFKVKKRWDREFSIHLNDTSSDIVKIKAGELFSVVEEYDGFKYIDVNIEEDFSISKNK